MPVRYSVHGQHHHIRRLKRTLAVLVFILLLPIAWVLRSYLDRPEEANTPVATTPRIISQQANVQVFQTPFFQFETTKVWAEAKDNPQGNGSYIYRAYQSTLIQQELTIYVNPALNPPEVTHVLPISLRDRSLIVAQPISPHCQTAVPAGLKDSMQIRFQDVSFMCDSDGTVFSVLVGEVKGTGNLTLPRTQQGTNKFIIVYRDLTAQPSGQDLPGIIKSFRSL